MKDTRQMQSLLDPEGFYGALSAQLNVTERLNVPCALLILRMEFEDIYVERFQIADREAFHSSFASAATGMVRGTDTVGWFAEGCLGILLRCVTAEETSLVAARLQKDLARRPLLVGGHNLYLAVQIGGVWTSGDRPMPLDDFTDQAYFAMLG